MNRSLGEPEICRVYIALDPGGLKDWEIRSAWERAVHINGGIPLFDTALYLRAVDQPFIDPDAVEVSGLARRIL